MKRKVASIFCFAVASLSISHAGEVIWYPLYGSSVSGVEPIFSMGQIGSEVHLGVGIHAFADSCEIPSNPVSVEFPTLFVVSCDYKYPSAPDVILYGSTLSSSYDYAIGDGWIYHRKGFANCEEVSESLGWVFIKHYPWVFTLDGGWRYVVEARIFEYSNAWWFYESDYGWFWSTRDLYPVIYHQGVGWTRYGLIQSVE